MKCTTLMASRPDELNAAVASLYNGFMTSLTRTKYQERAVLLAIVLAAFTLRLYKLNATSLWYDETFVLHFAQQGVVTATRELFRLDNAIPLHGILMAIWINLAGSGEFAARFSSVLLSTLTTPLIYHLSKVLSGRTRKAWWGAASFACLPIFIYYGQEVRMYALAMLLAAAFGAAYIYLLRQKTRLSVAIYCITGAMMLTAHLYTGLLWAALLGAGGLYWLCLPARRERHTTRTWLLANGLLALAGIPIAVWAFWRARIDATGVSAIPLDALRGIPIFYGIGQYIPEPWSVIFLALAGVTVLLAIINVWRSRRWHTVLVLLSGLFLPVILLILATLIKAKWSERYLLPSMGLALCVAFGVAGTTLRAKATWTRWFKLILIVSVCGLGMWASLVQAQGHTALMIQDEWHPRPDFRGAARYIEQHTESGDAIAVVAGYAATNLTYYYDGPAPIFGVPPDTYILDTRDVIDLNTLSELESQAGDAQQLWLVLWQDRLADPLNLVQSTLVNQCKRLPVSEHFANVGMLRFDISACRPLDAVTTPPNPLNIAFEAPISLKGYALIKTQETWEVDLWWESSGRVDYDYSVFVHLRDATGTRIAQHDHIAGDDAYPTSLWQAGTAVRDRFFLTVPGGTCKNCELYVGLYTTSGRLNLENGEDAIHIALENE